MEENTSSTLSVPLNPPPLSNDEPGYHRVYEFCGYTCTTGPDRIGYWLALFLVVIPFGFICAFVLYPYWTLGYPQVTIIGIILGILIFVLLLFAGLSDPGIVYRPVPPIPRPKPLWKNITISGIVIKQRFCTTCKLWRPPRAHHCRICNNCIAHFDHHCAWTGNCVGARNYRYFFWFITSVLVGCVYFTILAGFLVFPGKFAEYPVALVCGIYTVSLVFAMTSMVGYHVWLVARGKSTYESLKNKETAPFDEGCCLNFKRIFCAPDKVEYLM